MDCVNAQQAKAIYNCKSTQEKLYKTNTAMWFNKVSIIERKKKTPWLQSASEPYRQSGRRRSAKLVPTLADRGVSRGQRNGSPQP